MYTTVSIMKMYACSTTIRMWKIAQPRLSTLLNAAPTTPVAAHKPIDGKEVHRVHEQHPYKDRKRKRCNEAVIVMKQASHLIVDEFHGEFDEGLGFARHSRRRPARHKPQKPER